MKKKITLANANSLLRLQAIELRQAGNSIRAVAEQFGVDASTIANLARRRTYLKSQ
jgi:transposase